MQPTNTEVAKNLALTLITEWFSALYEWLWKPEGNYNRGAKKQRNMRTGASFGGIVSVVAFIWGVAKLVEVNTNPSLHSHRVDDLTLLLIMFLVIGSIIWPFLGWGLMNLGTYFHEQYNHYKLVLKRKWEIEAEKLRN